MNTLALSQSSRQITTSRRIGWLVYPGYEILDVCCPYDARHIVSHIVAVEQIEQPLALIALSEAGRHA